jgi:transaldolase
MLDRLRVKIFADGADLPRIREYAARPYITGFTTNPTLMRASGVSDYRTFALDVLEAAGGRPVSFEVLSDTAEEMERQARTIAAWSPNVYVKIPVTNTAGHSMVPVVDRLSADGIAVNVTAVMTIPQVEAIAKALRHGTPSVVSVFAGRIADTGRDPVPLMRQAREVIDHTPGAELLWASPRELLNLIHADEAGAHIITMTPDLLAKLTLLEKDLDQFSLETVQMFRRDAEAAGYDV